MVIALPLRCAILIRDWKDWSIASKIGSLSSNTSRPAALRMFDLAALRVMVFVVVHKSKKYIFRSPMLSMNHTYYRAAVAVG